MDDLADKLSGILNDPESMERVKAMAESLFSGKDEGATEERNPIKSILAGDNGGDMPDVAAIMRVVNLLKNQGNDNRSGLLMALKPHLSEERRGRVDKAVKILRLVSLMPLLKEQGILNL